MRLPPGLGAGIGLGIEPLDHLQIDAAVLRTRAILVAPAMPGTKMRVGMPRVAAA